MMGLILNPQTRWPREFAGRREWLAPACALLDLYHSVKKSNQGTLSEAIQWSLMRGVAITLNPEWALDFLQSKYQVSPSTLDNLRISPSLTVEQMRSLFANVAVPHSVIGWCLLESFDWSRGLPPECGEFLQSARFPPGLLAFMLIAKGKLDEASRLPWPSSDSQMAGVPSKGLFDTGSPDFNWMRGEKLFEWLATQQTTTGAFGQAVSWAAYGAGYSEIMTNGSSENLLTRLSELSNPALRRSFACGAVSRVARSGGADASVLVDAIKDPASRRGAIEALLPELGGAEKEAWERALQALPPLE